MYNNNNNGNNNKVILIVQILLLALAVTTTTTTAASLYQHEFYDNDLNEELEQSQLELLKTDLSEELVDDEQANDEFCEWRKCDKDLSKPRGLAKLIDFPFLKKFLRNLNPFKRPHMQMRFYLFRRQFPECGREIDIDDQTATLQTTGIDDNIPTRIIVHGWMSQSRGSFNRDVKNAYLKRGDFNVIVVDWSASASNLNYFSVVHMIEGFGLQLAKFTQHLNARFGLRFGDMYIIGHSLGAQIAGVAGRAIKPQQYNTIFALDPAGPKFRHRSSRFRIDATDAKYVESIQTSANLGFLEPTGRATFYPNYGFYQKSCFYPGCSHVRAYKMFAESIVSDVGFWGSYCTAREPDWQCEQTRAHKMGGEPSTPKSGLFFVETNSTAPFALGRK